MNRFLLIIITFLVLHVAQGQIKLTADEAISRAIQKSYDLLLLKNDSVSAAIDNSYAKAAFLPRINANAAILFNSNNQKQKLADGTTKEKNGISSNNITSAINLNWTIFDGFKMFATRDKLAELAKLGEFSIKNQVANTIAAVLTIYFTIVKLEQETKAINEQIKINEDRVSLAERKLSLGLGARPELLQAKVDMNAQKAALLAQFTLIRKAKEELNRLMVDPVENTFVVTDSIPIRGNLNMGEILSMVTEHPSLKLIKKNMDIAGLTVKEQKAGKFPVLSFNAAYNFSRTDNTTVLNTFTPLVNRNLGFNYGVSATIPILNGFNVKRLVQQAQLSIEKLKLQYGNLLVQQQASIAKSFEDYLLYKQAWQLEEENIGLAKENGLIALERFKQGLSTNLELREAQKSLEDAYKRLIDARYNIKAAEIELMRLRGDFIK